MQEKRKPIKRKGKLPHKKLNIKEPGKRKSSEELRKKPALNKHAGLSESKVKTSLNQRINEFKASGLTLLKGKKDEQKSIKINFRMILCAVAVIFIISIVLFLFNTPTGIVEYVGYKSALMKSGEGFPASFDFTSGGDITYSNGSFLVSTENDLKCYNRSGNLVFSRTHGFADAIVKTSKIRTLIYGITDSHYRIQTPNEEVFSKKTQDNASIITADISDCGVYAIATQAQDDIAIITVYDKDGNDFYRYHSANNYITGVSVSEKGSKMCVVSLSTNQAQFVSKLSIYDFDEETPIYETSLKNEIVYAVEYMNNSDICVITDKRYLNISNDEISESVEHRLEFLNKFEITDEYILIYNTADINSLSGSITVFDEDGDVGAQFSVEGNISDISVCDKSIYALGEQLTEYDFDGDLVMKTQIKNGAVKISASPDGAAVLYSSGIEFIEEG